MKQALGLVEIQGMSTAVVVADTMVKAANIRIIDMENTKGLGYMTIKIAGDVGAVNAAVSAGRQVGMLHGRLVSAKVIPRPSNYVEQTFCHPEPSSPAPESEAFVEPEPETPLPAETETRPEPEIKTEPTVEPTVPPEVKVTAVKPEPTAEPEMETGTVGPKPPKPRTGESEVNRTGAPKNKK